MSYVLSFTVEILLILTYDLCSTDQTMNDSLFHVIWVVRLEVQIMTCMSRFPVNIFNSLGPLFMIKTSKNRGVIIFNFYCEYDATEMMKLTQSCWFTWPNHESVVDISAISRVCGLLYPVLFPQCVP
jgi:hypothetical protein